MLDMSDEERDMSGFVGVCVDPTEFHISLSDGSYILDGREYSFQDKLDRVEQVLKAIEDLTTELKIYVICGVISFADETKEDFPRLASRCWSEWDLVIIKRRRKSQSSEEQAETNALKATEYYTTNHTPKTILGFQHRVKVDFDKAILVTLEDYKKTVSEKLWNEVNRFGDETKEKGLKIAFINATPQGGGVALMRHALIRFFRLLNISASWHVLRPRHKIFDITKRKFHNILQNVADPDCWLTDEDKQTFEDFSERNATYFADLIAEKDVFVIDDPQACGLIPAIRKKRGKDVFIIFRSHIQLCTDLIDKEGTTQANTWNFLWDRIKECDLFVSHPVKEFIPKGVPPEKILMMPATTDLLDGLNKPLSQAQISYYLGIFNRYLIHTGQTAVDEKRSFIAQVARFDPSKGIEDVLHSYRLFRQRIEKPLNDIPQLVITGHGSIDDPDGRPILMKVRDIIQSAEFEKYRDDIKVVQLPPQDQCLNMVVSKAKIYLQLSHKEGFEVKVTEALSKGAPVIAYKAGGIPLQIEDGKTGFLIEVGNIQAVADKLYDLFSNEELRKKISKSAIDNLNEEYFTVANARNWLFLAARRWDLKIPKQPTEVKDIIRNELAQVAK